MQPPTGRYRGEGLRTQELQKATVNSTFSFEICLTGVLFTPYTAVIMRTLASLGIVLTLVAIAAAETITSSFHLPLLDVVNVGTEDVIFSGYAHFVTQTIPTDPILPPNPVRVRVNLHNVVGTGPSGQSYQLLGTGDGEATPQPDGSIFVELPGFLLKGAGKPFLPPNPVRVQFFTVIGEGGFSFAEVHLVQGP